MPALRVIIPEGLSYESLKLTRDPLSGSVSFDWRPIERICEASGIDPAVFRDSHEDNVSALIVEWYRLHIASGGATDPVQAELLAEVRLEDEHGSGLSHTPGRA